MRLGGVRGQARGEPRPAAAPARRFVPSPTAGCHSSCPGQTQSAHTQGPGHPWGMQACQPGGGGGRGGAVLTHRHWSGIPPHPAGRQAGRPRANQHPLSPRMVWRSSSPAAAACALALRGEQGGLSARRSPQLRSARRRRLARCAPPRARPARTLAICSVCACGRVRRRRQSEQQEHSRGAGRHARCRCVHKRRWWHAGCSGGAQGRRGGG